MQQIQQQWVSMFIAQPNSLSQLKVPLNYLEMPIKDILNLVINRIGYSTRLYLYQMPVTSFTKLAHIRQTHVLQQILRQYPNLAITYNNTQFKQQLQSQSYQNFKNNSNSFILLLQICQQNTFSFQRYYIDVNRDILFIKSLCGRFGNHIFIQYYTLRIPINSFANHQKIQNTIAKYKDKFNRLTIYVTTNQETSPIMTIKGNLKINEIQYIEMHIEQYNQRFVIDRRVNWQIVSNILQILFHKKFHIKLEGQTKYIQMTNNLQINKQNLVFLRPSERNYSPIKQIKNCLLIGTRNNRIYMIQESFILHIYTLKPQPILLKSCMLWSNPTIHNDEDMGYFTKNHLILYSITINYIVLRYFNFQGEYLYTKRSIWLPDIYQIEFNIKFNVIDLLCVKIKSKNILRILRPDDSNNYVDIVHYSRYHQFYPGRDGLNNFSDDSGIFAIVNQFQEDITIYSLQRKGKIAKTAKLFKGNVLNLCFSPIQQKYSFRKMAIHYSNNQIHVYQLDKQLTQNIQIQTPLLNLQNVVSLVNSIQRIISFAYNKQLIVFQQNYVGIHSNNSLKRVDIGVILVEQTLQGYRVFMKNNPYLINSIKGFYLFSSKIEEQQK